MNKIFLKRLTNLARIMRDAAAVEKILDKCRGFTMSQWGYEARIGLGETCGAPACLLGHYAARRDVQRRFSLRKDGGIKTHGKISYPSGKIQRAADHFGITYDESLAMFGGGDEHGDNTAKTPAGAAQYVERFIKRAQKAA